MAASEQNVFFNKLTSAEKQSKLSQLASASKTNLVIWQKGKAQKYSLAAIDYVRSKDLIEISGKVDEKMFEKEVLASFELSGLHFFGKCKLTKMDSKKSYLLFDNDLFKSERRANFRLLTYPHQDVYVHLKIPNIESKDSNLVDLRTKISQTNLFNNFLSIIEEEGGEKKLDGYLRFRVLDISVTGTAIQFGEIEAELFDDFKKELGLMYLDFNGTVVEIPNGEVVYKRDFLAGDKQTKLYKAGMRFLNVNTNLDEKLSQLINEKLRSLESEFEDFLK